MSFLSITILDVLSCIALVTSLIGVVPQIIKTQQKRSVGDLSLAMVINFIICSAAWIGYGLLTNTKTVWLTNCLALLINIILLGQIIYYSQHERK